MRIKKVTSLQANPYKYIVEACIVYPVLVIVWFTSTNCINYINGTEELGAFITDILSGLLFTLITTLLLYAFLKKNNAFVSEKNQEILKSEAQYRSLAENLDMFISRFDLNKRYIYLNKQAKKMFMTLTLSEEAVLGKKPTELSKGDRDDEAYIENKLDSVIKSKEIFEEWFSFNENQYKWRLIPEFNGAGDVESVLSILFDVTDIKKTEDELARKSGYLNAIIEASPMAIVDLNKDGTVASVWNSTAEKMFGWTAKESIGSFLPIIQNELKNEYLERLSTCFADKRNKFTELPRRRKNGEIIYLDVTTCPLYDSSNNVIKALAFIEDVTKRKYYEDEIRKLSEIVKQSPDAVIVTDLNYKIEYVNPHFTALTGYTYDEAIGRSPITLLHGEIDEAVNGEIRESLLAGNVWKGEFLNKKKNGERYWASVQIGPVKDENGKIIYCVVNERDITAKKIRDKMIEDSLHEKEVMLCEKEKLLNEIRNLSEVVKQSPVSLIITDLDSRIEYVNSHFTQLTGYSHNEAIGHRPSKLIMANGSNEINKQIECCLSEGRSCVKEIRCKRKNGEEYWASMQVSYIKDDDGNIIKYMGLQQDITEMKLRDEQLRESLQEKEKMLREIHKLSEALKQNPNSLLITGTDGIIEYVNPAFTLLSEYSFEEAIGKNPLHLLQGKVYADTNQDIGLAITAGNAWKGEFLNKKKSGEEYWASVQIGPVLDENGNLLCCVAIEQDITEKKLKDNQLKQSLHEKEIMLKEIHHRVKNNLQVVSSLLKMQSGIHKNPETIEALKTSRDRITSMALVHENLYKSTDFSKIDMNSYISTLAANVFSTYGITSNKVCLSIETNNIKFGLDTTIPLGLILNEVISNSLKHAFPGNLKGEISLELKEEGDIYCLTVKDTGIGLPADFKIGNQSTLGTQLINILSAQLDGKLTMSGEGGTQILIKFKELKYKSRT